MDYTPRYSQPFTLTEAIELDVSVINEEIARLQNSLIRLRETQDILKSVLQESAEPDEDLAKAYEENQGVIGSQEERISILKMALAEKGIVGGAHYDVQPTARATTANPNVSAVPAAPPTANGDTHEEEEGVHL